MSQDTLFTSFQSLEQLLPKSFFSKMVPDMGHDGEIAGKGSVFSTLLKEGNLTPKFIANNLPNLGKTNYSCSHTHDNSCWNQAIKKLDV